MNESTPDPRMALTIQLLEWLAKHPRSYAEIMDAWRTTCPRLSIWEDACTEGLIDRIEGAEPKYQPSRKGHLFLGGEMASSAIP